MDICPIGPYQMALNYAPLLLLLLLGVDTSLCPLDLFAFFIRSAFHLKSIYRMASAGHTESFFLSRPMHILPRLLSRRKEK
jgi:hypothetical protein